MDVHLPISYCSLTVDECGLYQDGGNGLSLLHGLSSPESDVSLAETDPTLLCRELGLSALDQHSQPLANRQSTPGLRTADLEQGSVWHI